MRYHFLCSYRAIGIIATFSHIINSKMKKSLIFFHKKRIFLHIPAAEREKTEKTAIFRRQKKYAAERKIYRRVPSESYTEIRQVFLNHAIL